jgi:hypothetical protein
MVCNGMRNHAHIHTHTHETPKLKAIVDKDAYHVHSSPLYLPISPPPTLSAHRVFTSVRLCAYLPHILTTAPDGLLVSVGVTSSYLSSGLMPWLAPHRTNISFALRPFFCFFQVRRHHKQKEKQEQDTEEYVVIGQGRINKLWRLPLVNWALRRLLQQRWVLCHTSGTSAKLL